MVSALLNENMLDAKTAGFWDLGGGSPDRAGRVDEQARAFGGKLRIHALRLQTED